MLKLDLLTNLLSDGSCYCFIAATKQQIVNLPNTDSEVLSFSSAVDASIMCSSSEPQVLDKDGIYKVHPISTTSWGTLEGMDNWQHLVLSNFLA